jgi:hypothetical protein
VQQFDEIVKGITIDPAIQDWLVQAIKEGRKEEAFREVIDRLQHEVKTLKNRLEQAYLDKRSNWLRRPMNSIQNSRRAKKQIPQNFTFELHIGTRNPLSDLQKTLRPVCERGQN